ncbi:MAG: serine--tRNA ligase [Candidatus Levybacteria bacterium]|nr:serine--tRNA ligase [Candidatus Levybacteria bacterium]
MIDINLIRNNPKDIQKAAKNKNIDINVDHILGIDKKYKELSLVVQKLREERNVLTDSMKGEPSKEQIEKGKILKEKLEKEDHALKAVWEELKEKLYQIPNLPLKTVPIGDSSKFKIIKKVGMPKKFSFIPKDHLEIGEGLDIIDVKRGAKVSGTRFAYLKNEGALLELALIQFAMDRLIKEGFSPIFPPMLIRHEITEELGYWNAENSNNYYSVNNYEEPPFYLIGTAEHAIVPMHKDEIFEEKDLPKRYVGFSSAFRREAGTYGKDTRGILRVHQFDKVEMVSFVKPQNEEKERKKILFVAESFMQDLGLPYQITQLASGDLAFPSAETIDIETWMPSQNKYRETHSISTTTDFQSRRLNIKYNVNGEKKFVHILNGTAFAIGRTIISILENYQKSDGSVLIPKILQKYLPAGKAGLHFEKISPKKV